MNTLELIEFLGELESMLRGGCPEDALVVVQNKLAELEPDGDFGDEAGYVLSENQTLFCLDAHRQGMTIRYDYSGRGMLGAKCPSVTHDGEFHTGAQTYQDSMGRSTVTYARY